MSEPTIPRKPAIPEPAELDETIDPVDDEPREEQTSKGGRPSNKQLAADNKRLLAENQALRSALQPLAGIPEERGRPDDFALFQLARAGVSVTITNRDVRAARKLVAH